MAMLLSFFGFYDIAVIDFFGFYSTLLIAIYWGLKWSLRILVGLTLFNTVYFRTSLTYAGFTLNFFIIFSVIS